MSGGATISYEPLASTRQRGAEFYRLAFFFGLVYFVQGVAQHVSLLDQPVKNYFKSLGFDAKTTAKYLVALTLPWMIKPLYGLLSDFVPLLGYRRKSYLLLMNLLASAAFLWLAGLREPWWIVAALMTAAVGVAATDVLVDALMVERGKAMDAVKVFQGVQWICIYVALIGSGLLGGWLCQRLAPPRALSVAALVTLWAPVAVILATIFVVHEQRQSLDVEHLRQTGRGLARVLLMPRIWVVIGVLAVMEFSANMATVLYYHMSKNLGFSEQLVGTTKSMSAIGSVGGAVVFTAVLGRYLSNRTLVIIAVVLGVATKLGYLGLKGPATAWPVFIGAGFSFMIIRLTLLSLAAEACPKHVEGVTFAALMSASNLAMGLGDWASGKVQDDLFGGRFAPTAITWAAVTLLTLALVPLVPRGPGAPER